MSVLKPETGWTNDEPFTAPANWGGTGLMETPTARVLKEGRYRIGVSQISPYRYYYGEISPFRGLEIGGRVTETLGVPALSAAYGNTKDKAVDLKYQFISEGKYMPAVALGIMDPHGTRLFSSQYIVASKQIYPFDFTIGFGSGRFGKKPLPHSGDVFKTEIFTDPQTWRSDSQFFGGIQYALSDKYSFMVEYNPILYNKQTHDPAVSSGKYFQEAVPSKFNFGLRWRPYDWADIDLSYQRGNQLGMNLSFAFDLGKPLVPIYDHPYREKQEHRANPLANRITLALYESGFMDIGVVIEEDDLWIEAQNDKYFYNARAIGVMLRLLNDIAPPSIRKIHLILMDNSIPVLEFVTTREDIALYYNEKLTLNEFLYLSELKTDRSERLSTVKKHNKYFDYGIKPDLRTFLNDPSGFFKYRFGVSGWAAFLPWQGASLVAGPEYFFTNTVSSSNKPSSNAVRTDLTPYQQENVALGMLLFEQIEKFKHEIYAKVAGGLLEVEYAGLDGEAAMPLFGGRLMVGLGGSWVKKREPNSVFKMKDNDYKDYYTTAFLNMRLNIPEVEACIDLKSGQFLAGDRGTVITVSKFFNGFTLSAWYSLTNTSFFKDDYNRGYHDAGIAFSIPMRLFKGTDSKAVYNYALSPWTRDVAQDIGHYTSLFDRMGRNVGVYLKKDSSMIR